jgi:signal transduction histidine kinase
VNLKWYLITRIWLLAFLCLLMACAHVLWKTDREQRRHVAVALDAVSNQVINRFTATSMGFTPTGFDREGRFLFWDPVLGTDIMSGVCVRYVDAENNVRASSCRGMRKGARLATGEWKVPDWFSTFHRLVLDPGRESVRPLSWNGRDFGRVVAALDRDDQVAEAWREINGLIGLTVGTVLALCLLVYFVVSHALRPTRVILAGLRRLEQGDLSARLPPLRLRELQKMSESFNRLAASLEQSIADRADLTRKLVNLQEDERRHLSRELHDEFGQCLAAINAMAANIILTAKRERSSLGREGENLSRIAGHMMHALRNMLNRLRPPGIDELGLVESIEGLVAQYGGRGTQVELQASGSFGDVPETVTVSVYRIVQECLTNVVKHSGATRVKVRLGWTDAPPQHPDGRAIEVTVEDDGNADELCFVRNPGLGLLGMRERVTALGGQLTLRAGQPRGMIVNARIPASAVPLAPSPALA